METGSSRVQATVTGTPTSTGITQLRDPEGDPTVGYSTHNGLHNGLDVDALRIRATGQFVTSPRNRVYWSNFDKSLPIKGAVGNNTFYPGMEVWRTGYQSSDIGDITGDRMYYIMYIEGWPRSMWGWPTNVSVVGGDSGGPFFRAGTYFYQLVGFTSTINGHFASQQDATNVLNLQRWCYTDSCSQ